MKALGSLYLPFTPNQEARQHVFLSMTPQPQPVHHMVCDLF